VFNKYTALLPWLGLIGSTPFLPTVAIASPTLNGGVTALRTTTILITSPNGQSSGVIIERRGDVYTAVTTSRVIVSETIPYQIITFDKRQYQILSGSVDTPLGDPDLAIFKFRATTNYPTARVGNSNFLKPGADVFVGGFSPTAKVGNESTFILTQGKIAANSGKSFEDAYSLIYTNDTLPSMGGAPIFDRSGSLVGIHAKSDRERGYTNSLGLKTGFSVGIPINYLASLSGSNLGIRITGVQSDDRPRPEDYIVGATQKYRQGDYRGALADLNTAIQLNPNDAIAHQYRGALKVERLEDFPGGLKDLDRALEIDPNYIIALNNRASLRANHFNDAQSALKDLDRALQIDPNYVLALNNRASLRANRFNDPQSALKDLDRALQIDSFYASTYAHRGRLKANHFNDLQGGMQDLDRAIQLDPNYALAYGNRGMLKAEKLKDTKAGLADLDRAIQLNPNYVEAYNLRGILKANELKDAKGALADFDRAIQFNPNYAAAYKLRAMLKANELKDFQGALADFDRLIQFDPTDPQYYSLRGALKALKLKDLSGGTIDLNYAIQLNPSGGDAYYERGYVQYQEGYRSGGMADLQQAARLYQEQGNQAGLQKVADLLKKWGI
jgi:tetratricopeptide (TPR) repeat protein